MKFKIGDIVKIAEISKYYEDGKNGDTANPINVLGTVTKIDTDMAEAYLPITVEWSKGKTNAYSSNDLELVNTQSNNKMTTNQLMKDALRAQVDKLLKANNTVTTLEVKVELRKTDPEFYWDQATVSRMMDELYQDNVVTYTDNGTYRIYSQTVTPNPTVVASTQAIVSGSVQSTPQKPTKQPVKRITKTKALDLIRNSKGHFFKVVFVKKEDGKERTLNGQYVKDQTPSPLGLVRVKEASLMKQFKKEGTLANIPSKSVIRSFNINNLKSLGIGGETYKIRK